MKLLLTGKNRSGKTTLLQYALELIPQKKGFITSEVLDEPGNRIGFDMVSHQGVTEPLARVGTSDLYAVGRYVVAKERLDVFISRLPTPAEGDLLYIDEIGQMQLYSEQFQSLTEQYVDLPNDFVATISSIFQHSSIEKLYAHSDILVVTVTPENRSVLEVVVKSIIASRALFNSLSSQQQRLVLELARGYLRRASYSSLKKLYNNALRYVVERRVSQESDGRYIVEGDHASHQIHLNSTAASCDCELFNGRGKFVSQPGECSHIQAIKISRTN